MKLIKKFSLSFASPVIKTEYIELKRTYVQSFFILITLFLLLVNLYFFVLCIAESEFFYLIIPTSIFIFAVLLWKFSKRLKNVVDYFLLAFCLVLCIGGFVLTRDIVFVPSGYAAFLFGYSFGVFERIATLRLPPLKLKIAFSTIIFIVKVFMLPNGKITAFISQGVLALICFVIDFWKEKEERKLFQSFYDYREGLNKFRTLLVSGISTNILILDQNLEEELFSNESFQNTLRSEDPSDTPMNPFEWLDRLALDKFGLIDIERSSIKRRFSRASSVLQVLEVLRDTEGLINQQQKYTLHAEFFSENTEIRRREFEVKIFSMAWDTKDAIALAISDVTEHNTNLTLKVANANKDKMIAMVSHELRTPLNGILGMVHILEKQIIDNQHLVYLNVCKNSAKLLLNLVNSILDLGQIRNNKLKLNPVRTDLYELLREIYYLFKFQFDSKNLFLKLDISSSLSQFINTDQNRLKQIIINLVGNAMKFTFDGGVTLSAHPDPETKTQIKFKVSDTGTGIKKEDLAKLFKMYGKLDQDDPNVNTEGVGLGLTISDHLARLLCNDLEEGGIKVESKVNKGTEFSFSIKANLRDEEESNYETKVFGEDHDDISLRISPYIQSKRPNDSQIFLSKTHSDNNFPRSCSQHNLPKIHKEYAQSGFFVRRNRNSHTLAETPTDIQSLPTPLKMNPSNIESLLSDSLDEKQEFCKKESIVKKPCVLLVDDVPFNLMVGKHMIEECGYAVETVLNGKVAVEAAKNKNYCAIFMDLQMPVMDGYEATRELKNLMNKKEIKCIPIIALSANDSKDDKHKCKKAGMSDHLSKPLREDDIRRVLDKVKMRRFTGHLKLFVEDKMITSPDKRHSLFVE